MPKLLLQVKGLDWSKGMSFRTEVPYGGIFKTATSFDIFRRLGYLEPTELGAELGSGTITATKAIRFIVPVTVSNLAQFYVYADGNKVYLTDGSSFSDVSAQIHTAAGTTARWMDTHKGGIIYAEDDQVRFNAIPLAAGSDVQLYSGMTTGDHPGVTGPDGNYYIAEPSATAPTVIKITSVTGTVGNSAVSPTLEKGFVVRKLVNDGRYLVWFADNGGTLKSGKNRCLVAYWDLAKSTFDQIYEFRDAAIYSAEMVGDVIQFITPRGIHITNIATRPKLIVPFGQVTSAPYSILFNEIPLGPGAVTLHNNVLWFGSSKTATTKPIYAYGNQVEGETKRLYSPYAVPDSSGTTFITTIGSDNNNILAATSTGSASTKLYILSSGSNATVTANLATVVFPRPYRFHHARVVTRTAISAGNSVSLQLLTAASAKTVMATVTKTNSTDPGKRNLIFDPSAAGDSTDVQAFHELSDVKLTTNVAIQSIEIWGDEVDERGQYE